MFETDIGTPEFAPRFVPNWPHLRNRRRSGKSWIWGDAVISRCDSCVGPRSSAAWHIGLTYKAGSQNYEGQFWQFADDNAASAPFDCGDQLQIMLNPARPAEYYYPSAASDAAFDVGVILFGLGTGLLVAIFGLWHEIASR